MTPLTQTQQKRSMVLAGILCAILFIFLCAVRAPREDTVYLNSDAPYHVLHTMQCYRETPLQIHKFVPIVTLGAAEDKRIEWGATLPDHEGNFYYPSFSAAQFVAPYLALRAVGAPFTLQSLYWFNCAIYGLCAILTALLFLRLLDGRLPRAFLLAAATALYLCPVEIQHAQGVVYWAQSLFQLGFLVQLWCFILRENHRAARAGFWLLCLVLPYVEWTGYFVNVGFVLAHTVRCMQKAEKGKRLRAVFSKHNMLFTLFAALCTLGSLALFCAHYLMVVDAEALFASLQTRFLMRSAILIRTATLGLLLQKYWRGFGALLVLAGALCLLAVCLPNARRALWLLVKQHAWLLVAMTFPLIENMLLRSHATSYTYDTIKLIFILIAACLFALAALWEAYPAARRRVAVAAGCAVCAACAVMILQYNVLPNDYHTRVDYLDEDAAFASYINTHYPIEASLLANENRAQRGWENLLFGRNIYEWYPLDELISRADGASKRFVVILQALEELAAANIYQFTGFWVYDGRTLTLQYYAWENGVAVPQAHEPPENA